MFLNNYKIFSFWDIEKLNTEQFTVVILYLWKLPKVVLIIY